MPAEPLASAHIPPKRLETRNQTSGRFQPQHQRRLVYVVDNYESIGANVNFSSGTTASLCYYISQIIFNWGTAFLNCAKTTNKTTETSNVNYGNPTSSGSQLMQSCSS
ncbi:MAG TPA: hypothetical protein VJN71_02440 [Nitrososphaerales archaeon]|nr:hypothetical protein [Nitrososphaerales archaeon]